MQHTKAWSAVCYPDKIIFKNTLMSILPIIQGKSQRNSQFPLRPWCKLFYNNHVHQLGYFKSVFYWNVMIKVNCATCITFQDVNQSLGCISYNCTSWKNRHQLFFKKIADYTLETFSIGFFMEDRKPENVTWLWFSSWVCSLQFMLEGQEGRPAVSDLWQGFFPLKIVQPHV